jgi:hypothetical protein
MGHHNAEETTFPKKRNTRNFGKETILKQCRRRTKNQKNRITLSFSNTVHISIVQYCFWIPFIVLFIDTVEFLLGVNEYVTLSVEAAGYKTMWFFQFYLVKTRLSKSVVIIYK